MSSDAVALPARLSTSVLEQLLELPSLQLADTLLMPWLEQLCLVVGDAALLRTCFDETVEQFAHLSELVWRKSQAWLPQPPPEPIDTEHRQQEQRRAMAEQQRWQQFAQVAGQRLLTLPWLGRDEFAWGGLGAQPRPTHHFGWQKMPAYMLVKCCYQVMQRHKPPPLRHEVVVELPSLGSRMQRVIEHLGLQRQHHFWELLPKQPDGLEVLLTFLVLLELARLQLVYLQMHASNGLQVEVKFHTVEDALAYIEQQSLQTEDTS